MRPGARTPEELETLFEDAFVVGDRAAVAELFEDGALLVMADARWRAAQLRSPGSQLRSGITTSPTSPIRSTSCRRATRRSSSHRTAWRFGQLAEIMAAATCALVLLLVLPGGARAATASYSYTGVAQAWTVPAGVSKATFDVYGAQGGTASGVGGLGERVRATLGVTPGEVLAVYVGAQGATGVGAAFNGGAGGGAGGAGGGGASDVRRGAGALADRVLVAGGGGGGAGGGYGFHEYPFYEQHCSGGAGGAGGNGGETTVCLPGVSGGGGGPATASAGGSGGSSNYGGGKGTAGQLAVGGAGGADAGITEGGDGGGGGGGLFGGGGGAGGGFFDTPSPGNYRYEDGAGGGGGGGSSFIASPATDAAVTAAARTGAGQVTISYEVRPGATTGSAGPGAPTGNAGPNAPPARPSIVGGLAAGRVKVAKSGRFALRTRVACAGAGAACRVKVNVTTTIAAKRAAKRGTKPKRRTVRLGGASFSVEAGQSTRVRAKLTRTGLRLLRQRRTLKVKIRITVVRGAHTNRSTVAATLRAPR